MTAAPPVLSPNSILLPPSYYCALIPDRKRTARVSKLLFIYLFILLLKNCVNLKLYKSGNVFEISNFGGHSLLTVILFFLQIVVDDRIFDVAEECNESGVRRKFLQNIGSTCHCYNTQAPKHVHVLQGSPDVVVTIATRLRDG